MAENNVNKAVDKALLKILNDYIDGKEIKNENSEQQKIIIEVAKVVAQENKRFDELDHAKYVMDLDKEKLEIEKERLAIDRNDREFRRGIDDDRMNNEHEVELARIDIENSKLDLDEKHKKAEIKTEKLKLYFTIGSILLKGALIALDRNAIMRFETNGIVRSAAWKHVLTPKNL